MVARGRVQDGVVVLDNGVPLPEGQEVTVVAHATVPPAPQMEGMRSHSLRDIATVRLGSVPCPLNSDNDLLGEINARTSAIIHVLDTGFLVAAERTGQPVQRQARDMHRGPGGTANDCADHPRSDR